MSLGRHSQLLVFVAALLLYVLGAVPQAQAETGGYPYWDATQVDITNYDWGYTDCKGYCDTSVTKKVDGKKVVYYVLSERGYGIRNCTDYVAWKLESLGISPNLVRGRGNANQWDDNGTGVTITKTPEVGDAAVWNSGRWGHLAFVEEVRPNGAGYDVRVSEYNKNGDGNFRNDRWTQADNYVDFNGVGVPIGGSGGPFTVTQPISVGPSDHITMYQAPEYSYRIKNTSGAPASIRRLVVGILGPGVNNNLTQNCDSQTKLSLQPNEETVCHLIVGTGFGQVGTYRFWADWQDWNGKWHEGQLGSSQNFFYVSAATTLTAVQPISVGPSDHVSMLSSVRYSYRIKNTSQVGASLQRIVVGVRGPAGDDLTQDCQGTENHRGLTLAAGQEWTCSVYLPNGYGSSGTFRFYADWQDGNSIWHPGMLGSTQNFLYVQPGPTLTVMQPISVGPSDNMPKLQKLWWGFRVRNTSGSVAIIRQFSVAVRGPAGDNLDTPCVGGSNVTLAPGQEWTCYAERSTGYGSTGNFRFWADWQDMNYAWHPGYLGGSLVLTLY